MKAPRAGEAAARLALLLAVWLLPGGRALAQDAPAGTLVIESRPPGAHVVLDGELHIEGIAPFVVDRGVYGPYRARASLSGHQAWQREVTLTGTGRDTLRVSLTPLTRGRAVLRSAVVPGWGQRYLGRDREGSLFFFGAAAVGAAAGYAHSRYASAMDDYEERRDAYAVAEGVEEIRGAYLAMEDSYREVRDRRDRRNALLWTGAVIWAAGVVDALLNPPSAAGALAGDPAEGGLDLSLAVGTSVRLAWRHSF